MRGCIVCIVCSGIIAPDVLVLVCSAVTCMLTDAEYGVCEVAINTLGNLTRKRAWLHWGRRCARSCMRTSFVCMSSSAMGALGDRLCAPGGKWAACDRIEFVDVVVHLLQ